MALAAWTLWALGAAPGPAFLTPPPKLAAHEAMGPMPPARQSAWRASGSARAQRLIMGRFFGLGPRSRAGDVSGWARAHAGGNVGWERRLALGAHGPGFVVVHGRTLAAYDVMVGGGQPGLPPSRSRYPKVPGMRGAAAFAGAGLDLRWDGRHTPHSIGHEPRAGALVQVGVTAMGALFGSPSFVRLEGDARALWAQSARSNTALRAVGRWVSDPRVPFYLQPALGGAHLLRGHSDGRFVGQGAWSLELEQRLWVGRTHVGRRALAWHLDPFVTLGQVWQTRADWRLRGPGRPLWTAGLGMRALWAPHGVLRLDVATDRSVVRGHLGLGYPL